ncbi:MAG: type II toxin-antitoxin system VapC family toxin [Desulfobacula sp.]|jgi:uncharacterized protein|nr:type II toxin-antitoxin system VapC family toxin [Desulfobacula sp.]
MKETFVLDACALIAFFNDESGADIVEKLLEKAEYNNIDLIMNKINLLEIYYGIYRDDGIETASSVIQIIRKMPVQVISSLSDKLFLQAGHLKAKYKISLADSIALAEAIIRKAKLVTADHHELDRLEKTQIFEPLWIR